MRTTSSVQGIKLKMHGVQKGQYHFIIHEELSYSYQTHGPGMKCVAGCYKSVDCSTGTEYWNRILEQPN